MSFEGNYYDALKRIDALENERNTLRAQRDALRETMKEVVEYLRKSRIEKVWSNSILHHKMITVLDSTHTE